jgi:hypothetical protein
LGEQILPILATGAANSRGVVLLRHEWLQPTELWVKSIFPDVHVWSKSAGISIPPQQLLVLVGRPARFARDGVDTIPFVTSPRAESTCFVQFDFLGEPRGIPGLLLESSKGVSRRITGGFTVPSVLIDDSDDEVFDWEQFKYPQHQMNGEPAEEFSEAFAVTFADGSYTFILGSDERSIQVAESDPSGRIKLSTHAPSELRIGDVLILRTEGSDTGNVRELADSKFGAAEHRQRIAIWKDRVRSSVDAADGIAAATRAIGANTSASRNLSYWLSDSAIRPRDRSDFDAVSEFAGISTDGREAIWRSMSEVFAAHHQAGILIRDLLETGLEGRSLESLEDAEFFEVEIEGFGTLRASRVTGISPSVQSIPHRWVGMLNPKAAD